MHAGDLIREWRQRRRLSQLDLAIAANVSSRHLSFVETGRSRPTSEMILHLAEHLDVPLRDRNALLLAGGFAPAYPERGLAEPELHAVKNALKRVLRLSLHPDGMAPRIANLPEWRAHLLARLHRQAEATGDQRLTALHDELSAYPGGRAGTPGPADVVVPLRYRAAGAELSFLSITAVIGTPMDVTVEELAIESFYPADHQTAKALA
jgi:transcriptional regulator with XRE-family HTH domain